MNYGHGQLSLGFIAIFTAMQLCPNLKAQNSRSSLASLAGITTLCVVIEDLPPGAVRLGLTKDTLQTDVELKLRLAGMRVIASNQEALYVNVNTTADSAAVNASIEVLQPMALVRAPRIVLGAATTWSIGKLATFHTAGQVRDLVKDEVDTFLNDWLTVNPKN
jgi:hypothetical protein